METPVYATPKNHLYLSGTYNLNKFKFSANIQRINDLNSVSDGTAPHFENYTLLNAKISYHIWKYADIFVSGNNLLNQKYETNRYYPMPGITAFGGVNFNF
jgi:iron complex outermembrane receptor protein